MILTFEDDDLEKLYGTPGFVLAHIGPELKKAYLKTLNLLEAANSQQDIRAFKALRLEKLAGDRDGQHSVRINQQWRLILILASDSDPIRIVEIVDYH